VSSCGAGPPLRSCLGVWSRRSLVQKSGLVVLTLFVGKLFFVDLATLPTLDRIGLFLGMCAGFLAISYLLPGLGRADDGSLIERKRVAETHPAKSQAAQKEQTVS
jgi:uncharacterized membrane protein